MDGLEAFHPSWLSLELLDNFGGIIHRTGHGIDCDRRPTATDIFDVNAVVDRVNVAAVSVVKPSNYGRRIATIVTAELVAGSYHLVAVTSGVLAEVHLQLCRVAGELAGQLAGVVADVARRLAGKRSAVAGPGIEEAGVASAGVRPDSVPVAYERAGLPTATATTAASDDETENDEKREGRQRDQYFSEFQGAPSCSFELVAYSAFYGVYQYFSSFVFGK